MKLLICSDGSPQAQGALEVGGLLAQSLAPQDTTLVGITEQNELLPALVAAQEHLRTRNVEAALLTKHGDPVESIVKLVQEQAYDMVVIGGSRHSGPLARPAKVYDMIRRVNSRVLLVGQSRPKIAKILVCTGGAYVAERAVRFTAGLAQALNASVQLFHVMAEPPSLFEPMKNEEDVQRLLASRSGLARALRRQQQQLEEAGVPHTLVVRYGLVVDCIMDEIQKGDYDLVVAGTHPISEGRFSFWMMGNMTRAIVEEIDRPILIVRTAEQGESLVKTLKRMWNSAFSK